MPLPNTSYPETKECADPIIDIIEFPELLTESQYKKLDLTTDPRIFLRKGVAERLLRVQARIQKEIGSLRLKIWDAYRPRELQDRIHKKEWLKLQTAHPGWTDEKLKEETDKYVTPAYQEGLIPPHSTGGAIDLTLVYEDGRNMNMGTIFDHFGPEAKPDHFDHLDPEIARNRKRLRDAMLAEDFIPNKEEWWHYEYGTEEWAKKTGAPHAIHSEVHPSVLLDSNCKAAQF